MTVEIRPDNIPTDWSLMKAEDGCTYWVSPIAKNNPDYFFPCGLAEDETKNDSWHCSTELSEVTQEASK